MGNSCNGCVKPYIGLKKTMVEVPGWLDEWKVYAMDAGDEPVHKSGKADYRLHYAVGLFDLGMKKMSLTGTDCGKKVSTFKGFTKHDLVIGDRAYCNKTGIAYHLEWEIDFLFRYGTKGFMLFNEQGRKVNLLGILRDYIPVKAGSGPSIIPMKGNTIRCGSACYGKQKRTSIKDFRGYGKPTSP